jgi:hypothetical protein
MNDTAFAEIHTGVTKNRGLELNGQLNAGFWATPAVVVLSETFEAKHAADVRESKSSLALDTLFHSSSDSDSHSVKLSDFGSFQRAYSISDSEKASGKDADGNGDKGWDVDKSEAPTTVPEPGSISLLLIGLAGIGIRAYRRGNMPKARPLPLM